MVSKSVTNLKSDMLCHYQNDSENVTIGRLVVTGQEAVKTSFRNL